MLLWKRFELSKSLLIRFPPLNKRIPGKISGYPQWEDFKHFIQTLMWPRFIGDTDSSGGFHELKTS